MLCILDPFDHYDFHKDTSHLLLLEFARRGFVVYYAEPGALAWIANKLVVHASRVSVLESSPYFQFHDEETLPANLFNLILMRKDPPVDLTYLFALQLLSRTTTPVINDPQALSRWNEKLMILNFPEWIPETLVSSDPSEIIRFCRRHEPSCILKSLMGFAGKETTRISQKSDLHAILQRATQRGKLPVMVQEFLPISSGEKRVFMINGEPIGVLKRTPQPGDFITNPDQGARIAPARLTDREAGLCEKLKPFLRKNNIFFAGVDLIGEKLIEVNITSPGFLWELNEVDSHHYERDIVDKVLGKL